MGLALDRKLKIRSMVYVAGEPIPYFWPMRNFIHHNPLHGLEKLPFAQAVERVFCRARRTNAFCRKAKLTAPVC
jgi:uncharacterized protein YbcC (UPF0753/DUF2309 family)